MFVVFLAGFGSVDQIREHEIREDMQTLLGWGGRRYIHGVSILLI